MEWIALVVIAAITAASGYLGWHLKQRRRRQQIRREARQLVMAMRQASIAEAPEQRDETNRLAMELISLVEAESGWLTLELVGTSATNIKDTIQRSRLGPTETRELRSQMRRARTAKGQTRLTKQPNDDSGSFEIVEDVAPEMALAAEFANPTARLELDTEDCWRRSPRRHWLSQQLTDQVGMRPRNETLLEPVATGGNLDIVVPQSKCDDPWSRHDRSLLRMQATRRQSN
jgi:hypothetical protein